MLPYVFLGEWISPRLAWLKIGSYGVMMALALVLAVVLTSKTVSPTVTRSPTFSFSATIPPNPERCVNGRH